MKNNSKIWLFCIAIVACLAIVAFVPGHVPRTDQTQSSIVKEDAAPVYMSYSRVKAVTMNIEDKKLGKEVNIPGPTKTIEYGWGSGQVIIPSDKQVAPNRDYVKKIESVFVLLLFIAAILILRYHPPLQDKRKLIGIEKVE